MDDVYFAVAMAAQGYAESPEAVRVWTTIIRPLLKRSPRFRGMIAQNIFDGPVRTPAGLVVSYRMAVNFAAPRIERIVRRIVRGLLWHHYRKKPAADCELVIFHHQAVPSEVADIINGHTNMSWIGDTIFRYRHGVAHDAPGSSIWALQFYAQTQFIVVVQEENFVRGEQELALAPTPAPVSPDQN